MHPRNRSGFTLVELLVVIAIISLLVGILVPALSSALRSAKSVKDATQIAQVHKGFLIYADSNTYGHLATPGLINRWTDPRLGDSVPGTGMENEAKNSSGHLYSAMIAQEYFNTDILMSPVEAASNVQEYRGADGNGYEYEMYDPAVDTYWAGDVADPAQDNGGTGPQFRANDMFKVKINRPVQYGPCYTSYAHLMLCGDRRTNTWRNNQDSSKPVFSTRTPKDGAVSGDEYTRSPTLLLHGGEKEWNGQVCFNDNHVEYSKSVYPNNVAYECGDRELTKDNIGAAEFGDCEGGTGDNGWKAGDTWLCLSETIINVTGNWKNLSLYDKLND